MLKKSNSEIGKFRRFLTDAIDEIEGLDAANMSIDGDAYLRRCAGIVSAAGVQAIHAGFADLHERSHVGEFTERTTALAFLADCVARCREADAGRPGAREGGEAGMMMTADEVAAFLGITVRSVRRRVLDGTLPKPVKIGRSVRFQRKDIEAVASGK